MMKNGDILLYLDSGCEVDVRKKQQMKTCFNYAKRDLIVAAKIASNEDGIKWI